MIMLSELSKFDYTQFSNSLGKCRDNDKYLKYNSIVNIWVTQPFLLVNIFVLIGKLKF